MARGNILDLQTLARTTYESTFKDFLRQSTTYLPHHQVQTNKQG